MYSLFFSVAPNYSRTFILDLTFDFIHTTPAVSRSVNLGGRKKKKGLPGKFPMPFLLPSCQLTAGFVTIEPCILIVLGSLSPLLQPRTTQVLTSVYSISVPLRPFSRLRNHIFVVSFLLYVLIRGRIHFMYM